VRERKREREKERKILTQTLKPRIVFLGCFKSGICPPSILPISIAFCYADPFHPDRFPMNEETARLVASFSMQTSIMKKSSSWVPAFQYLCNKVRYPQPYQMKLNGHLFGNLYRLLVYLCAVSTSSSDRGSGWDLSFSPCSPRILWNF
jgi:hypothetical protein